MNNTFTDINKQASDLGTKNNEIPSGTEGTSILSKVLVDHMPQVTPVSLSKWPKPKARLAICLQMLQEKEAKRNNSLRRKSKDKRKVRKRRNFEKKKPKGERKESSSKG